ncbi:DMT family transporter [Vitiosangium sp. GDMCC 1.1324]|uniref:DMT family transporter n=1 Tax=Vitiosangium sp. (strain GDMCC 1.1324) TaxID=2138576 RepID=UPI001E5A759B|nr:DMT family transporter [Vitiosangium sp. GDMCC 1.1324]
MSPTALVLVLSSAFFHALWNALLKRHEDPESAVVGVIAVTVVCGGLWALGLQGAAFPSSGALFWSLAAGVLESGYLLTLARALRRAPLGLAYTVSRGGALLLVWPVSVLWLGEQLTPGSVAGAALVAVGMAGMNLVLPRGAVGQGVLWALVSAACIAGYNLSYKRALGEGAQPPALFTLSLGVALPLLVLVRLREEAGWGALRRKVMTRPLLLVTAGVLCTLSFSLLLIALVNSGTGAVLTLRNTSIAFALGLGALQGERMGRRQLAGAGLVMLGAVLLGWPRS